MSGPKPITLTGDQWDKLAGCVDDVSTGIGLLQAFQACGLDRELGVNPQFVYRLVGRDEVLTDRLLRARIQSGQSIEDKITNLIESTGVGAKDKDVMIKALMWRAERANPKIYATNRFEISQTVTIDLKQSLTDTQAALLESPMIDVTPLKIGHPG